jgi:hypothetical protein
MNSSGLLDPSYLSMCPALNFSSQTTCLSSAARARKSSLPGGVTPHTGERRGGVGGLALRCLRSSITLQRSPRSSSYSCIRWFCVIRQRASLSARWRLPLADEAASLQAHFARSVADGRFSSGIVDRSFCYDVVGHLSPLLCQSDKGRAFRCHALN